MQESKRFGLWFPLRTFVRDERERCPGIVRERLRRNLNIMTMTMTARGPNVTKQIFQKAKNKIEDARKVIPGT